ncbi:MAG: four helix bundle protein [Patescibacteria group bacterium]|nr:four helix bundle protein [Patescibacteria group bacterium]
MSSDYSLENLVIYQLSRELSRSAWNIYRIMDLDQKIIIGQQFVRATDSIGANIAEGYGRYHYLDKVKFYYNSRASLLESKHWMEVLNERDMASESEFRDYYNKINSLYIKLNAFIKFNLDKKSNSQ